MKPNGTRSIGEGGSVAASEPCPLRTGDSATGGASNSGMPLREIQHTWRDRVRSNGGGGAWPPHAESSGVAMVAATTSKGASGAGGAPADCDNTAEKVLSCGTRAE